MACLERGAFGFRVVATEVQRHRQVTHNHVFYMHPSPSTCITHPLFRDHSRRVFAGSQAGPVATLWDDRQLRLYLGGATRPDVSIWSCSGRQMGLILWEHGRVVAGGWTPDETLVLIETDGQVRRARVMPAAGMGDGG